MNIVLIGAGNVATHLGKRLFEKGHTILQVFSRTEEKATLLAYQIQSQSISDLKNIEDSADIYIIAVKDDAIQSVANQLPFRDQLIVHTSGATPSTALNTHQYFGVFYPLQTFSIEKKADFEKLPICIDANSDEHLQLLKKLANSICPNVYTINDKERAILHVCAVIVNNFTNHLYTIADDILNEENISLNILKPLIQETVNKIQQFPPSTMQTGPAIRNDTQTIDKHLNYLDKLPQYKNLYQILSNSIQQFHRIEN